MMARKLAGLFTVLALVAYFSTWLGYRFFTHGDSGGFRLEESWQTGIGVAVFYFLVGLFIATLAIGLMHEVMAERRSRETERRFRARLAYDAILQGEVSDAVLQEIASEAAEKEAQSRQAGP